MYQQFDLLPDSARVWIFPFSHQLSAEQEVELSESMTNFVHGWKAHSQDVLGSFFVYESRLLVVAADVEKTMVSGCSIDSLFKAVAEVAEALIIEVADPSMVVFRQEDGVVVLGRLEFQEAVNAGSVTAATKVFDNTIQSMFDLRQGRWERPFCESWHAKAFA